MNLFFLATFFWLAYTGQAQNKIVVQVSNFKNNKGVCIVCLYNNASAYSGKGEPTSCVTVGITNYSASANFENLSEGDYAISVIHDANGNKKFDKNFLGIPTEGYGASQNKLPFAAAPKFDENKFFVGTNTTTTSAIKLRYIF